MVQKLNILEQLFYLPPTVQVFVDYIALRIQFSAIYIILRCITFLQMLFIPVIQCLFNNTSFGIQKNEGKNGVKVTNI